MPQLPIPENQVLTDKHIIEQENKILRYAISNPGRWKIGTISAELRLPKTTIKSRLSHLRAVGYLERYCQHITPTDDGRVAYFRRRTQQ